MTSDKIKYDPKHSFRPFTYTVIDFNHQKFKVNGFFPADVRKHCNFNILKIEGPIVNSFSSWLMYQLVKFGNK